jgi:DNA-directed RNA polymerase specialized sigma24 family protein
LALRGVLRDGRRFSDAEALVQTTFLHALKRPGIIRANNERGYPELSGGGRLGPTALRDAVIAVGLSYREAAGTLRTQEKPIATRLHRGRQPMARELSDRSL